jgi:hypothetical protein
MIKYYFEYINESLNSPLDKDKPVTVSTWYKKNLAEFQEDAENELKKLIGETIYFEGQRKVIWRLNAANNGYVKAKEGEPDKEYKVNGKIVRNVVKAKIKDIKSTGKNFNHIEVTSDENKVYTLYKIVDKKSFDNYHKKIKDLEEKEKILKDSIGKTIYFNGYRKYDYRQIVKKEDKDPVYRVDGKEIKTVYKEKVKKIVDERGSFIITTEDDKEYFVSKMLDKKAYDRFYKKVEKEIERREEVKKRKEDLKIKMRHLDPYGEEDWDDDNPGRYDKNGRLIRHNEDDYMWY